VNWVKSQKGKSQGERVEIGVFVVGSFLGQRRGKES